MRSDAACACARNSARSSVSENAEAISGEPAWRQRNWLKVRGHVLLLPKQRPTDRRPCLCGALGLHLNSLSHSYWRGCCAQQARTHHISLHLWNEHKCRSRKRNSHHSAAAQRERAAESLDAWNETQLPWPGRASVSGGFSRSRTAEASISAAPSGAKGGVSSASSVPSGLISGQARRHGAFWRW